jgi:hypothetical protein
LAFLQNHRKVIVAFDFFTAPTLTFQLLCGFFVIERGRRRILNVNVTRHPIAERVVQQLREVFPELGPYAIVIDDLHNVNEAESDTVRRSVLDRWDTVMSTPLNDPKTGARVIVMQRVHKDDLSGHVLAQGGYEHLCLSAEYEEGHSIITSIGWSDPRTVAGELLWPERFVQAEIDALKRSMGSYAAAGQLQQRPAPAEGRLFKRPLVALLETEGHLSAVSACAVPAGRAPARAGS